MPSLTPFVLILLTAFATVPLDGVSARSVDSLFSRAESGINCDGNLNCWGYKDRFLPDIRDKANKIPKGTIFTTGQQLACAGQRAIKDKFSNDQDTNSGNGICASVGMNTASFTVGDSTNGQTNSAGDIIEDLIYHGCQACGTAPINRMGNQLSQGSITVNYVDKVCEGLLADPCKMA